MTRGLFDITKAKPDKGQDIRIALTDRKGTDDDVYTLTIENTRKTAGRYQDIVRLFTTSKEQQEILIPVWGNIRPPQIVSIMPRHVVLNGPIGKPIKRTVIITPRDASPFSITEVKAQSGQHIKWDLQETGESGKKTYTLTLENQKTEKGRYYDTIFLKTDTALLPEIRISVSGHITD